MTRGDRKKRLEAVRRRLPTRLRQPLFATLLLIPLGFGTANHLVSAAETGEPVLAPQKIALPEIGKDIDEFYARVDEVVSPTALRVTILDAWNPEDKLHGLRWPNGEAKVQPAKRTIFLEETSVPNNGDAQKAAVDFVKTLIQKSNHEILCTGSNVAVKKEPQGEVICVTAYVYVKKGYTINNALVRQGLATTSNPFYKSWQEEAKQKKLGIWRDPK